MCENSSFHVHKFCSRYIYTHLHNNYVYHMYSVISTYEKGLCEAKGWDMADNS